MIRIDDICFDSDYYEPLIQYLMNNTGINLDCYRSNFVERRIKSRMIRVNCNTLETYYNYLLQNPLEIEKFIDCFNINYSVFFRNWEIFKQFEKFFLYSLYLKKNDIISDLIPNPDRQYRKLLNKQPNSNQKRIENQGKFRIKSLGKFLYHSSIYKKIWNPSNSETYLNIWSCPCANGEEPYSIAMILDNLKNQVPGFPNYRIIASDIDKDALKKAKIGIYTEEATKSLSKYYENKYFTKREEFNGFKYVINPKIKDYVEFIEEDITKGHKKALKYDVIFCRYLLIYISRKARDNFLKIIKDRLNLGGLLILGKTESLIKSNCNLKLIDSYNRIYMNVGD